MATEVTLPALGESVTDGTVTRWLKNVGESFAVDEPLLEVSTDKVDTEIPSPVAGTLLEIRVSEDEPVEVGAALALVGNGQPTTGGGGDGGQERIRGGGGLRHPAGPQARSPAPRGPVLGHRIGRGRPDPQGGRPRGGP